MPRGEGYNHREKNSKSRGGRVLLAWWEGVTGPDGGVTNPGGGEGTIPEEKDYKPWGKRELLSSLFRFPTASRTSQDVSLGLLSLSCSWLGDFASFSPSSSVLRVAIMHLKKQIRRPSCNAASRNASVELSLAAALGVALIWVWVVA